MLSDLSVARYSSSSSRDGCGKVNWQQVKEINIDNRQTLHQTDNSCTIVSTSNTSHTHYTAATARIHSELTKLDWTPLHSQIKTPLVGRFCQVHLQQTMLAGSAVHSTTDDTRWTHQLSHHNVKKNVKQGINITDNKVNGYISFPLEKSICWAMLMPCLTFFFTLWWYLSNNKCQTRHQHSSTNGQRIITHRCNLREEGSGFFMGKTNVTHDFVSSWPSIKTAVQCVGKTQLSTYWKHCLMACGVTSFPHNCPFLWGIWTPK